MKRQRQGVPAETVDSWPAKPGRVLPYTPSQLLRRRLIRQGLGPALSSLFFLLSRQSLWMLVEAQDASESRSLRALQATGGPTAAVPSAPSMEPTPSIATPTTTTSAPTPALEPTQIPTAVVPSAAPTPINVDKQRFSQSFEVVNNTFFTDPEEAAMELLFEGYTSSFAPSNETDLVRADSVLLSQKFAYTDTNESTAYQCIIDYTMEYSSTTLNVTGYTDMFISYMNGNLAMVTRDLQELGLDVMDAMETQFVQVETTGPTATAVPSLPPPTTTPFPTSPPPTIPTSRPTSLTFPPTPGPMDANGTEAPGRDWLPVIVPVTVLSGMAVLIAIVFLTKRNRTRHNARATSMRRRNRRGDEYPSGGDAALQVGTHYLSASEQGITVIPRLDSPDSMSLVSDGDSGASPGSGKFSTDETKKLQDEFDEYKDLNLEELRTNVEGNLSGFEGIMSAAMTKALMGDEDAVLDTNELLWGCKGNPTGAEVEASALVIVSDWIKRNDTAPVERKRAFMQGILNKMVASVRFGVIDAEDASRTIHESAALLGLQLANELPMTTVIVSGMRKTAKVRDIVQALSEFGDIDTVAVASEKRGFGLVRFKNAKSVERAMRRYRNGEIVVQDVAVQVKVIMPSGEVLSRA